jgi:excisionase family DNA binding protein
MMSIMNTELHATEQTIHDDPMSLRQAAKVLGVNRNWLSAYLEGREIRLIRIGPSLGIKRSDLEKIRLKLSAKEGNP